MNGYISFEMNGQKVGLKFGLPANRDFVTMLNEHPEYLNPDGSPNGTAVAYLLYYGYKNNCLVKQEKATIPFESFHDFVDDAQMEEGEKLKTLVEISECYAQSRYTKFIVEKAEEEVKKKKSTGKKSKVSA